VADDETGVRLTLMRGGTSRGLYVEAADLPADPAARNDLLLRLMGTPDPRQIDGLGGATSLTSKVAVVGPSAHPDADVDYLFLQLGVEQATVSDQQNCGNILAGVGPFALERGLVPVAGTAADGRTDVRIRMVNSDSSAVATVPTPGGRVSTGHVRDTVDGVEVTCVDNGMPAVLALAEAFGLSGYEGHEELAADAVLAARVDAFRTKAGALMGLGDVAGSSVPKTVLLAPPADGGHVATRSFIPVRPHSAVGVLAAVSVVTGMLLPGAVGHEIARTWPAGTTRIDVEHPTGHFLVDVAVDATVSPPRVVRSGVVRTARTLMDGVAYPRPAGS
jgi:4-oxalomesaconate tautomerase